MSQIESIFQENALRLDGAFSNALSQLVDMELRLENWDSTEYHYKNPRLSWCKKLIQEKAEPPEIYRLSVSVNYREPVSAEELPMIEACTVVEVFQSGATSRIRRQFTESAEISEQSLDRLGEFIREQFDQGWRVLRAEFLK
ncbi:MAG: hypothetical protein SFV17_22930 [Candidatus Obscuribacter sp.]|nr:hypothetical protein [Candidatus Melainabacteria bacterium]MDX1989562.1 hypothetical protein [Candidatus Obscuribacter sp.]